MRLASFNLENLFTRAEVMNLSNWDEGKDALDDIDALNALISKEEYTDGDKKKIETILDKYDFANRNKTDRPFTINEVREKLYKVPKSSDRVAVVADGRNAWVGWVELRREEVAYEATLNTARVLQEIDADVVAAVEVENRITMCRFHDQVLEREYKATYPHLMCVDGNDARGIDVGILSRFPVVSVRSHIDDLDAKGTIFSRDCCEYEVLLPGGKSLVVLANHFKSKGYGSMAASDEKRRRQATRVAEIYKAAVKRSEYVAVVGDLNDTPDSKPLAPIKGTDLKDISEHNLWKGDVGTYGTGKSKGSKIDYILLSPALWKKVTAVGVERRGIYAPSLKIMWPGLTKTTAASDHAALWVELDV